MSDKQNLIRVSFLRNLNIYREFRDYIKHEDNLVNFRTSWFIQLNSFLFAAMALLLTRDNSKPMTELNLYFGLMVCFVGGLISYTTFRSVGAAIRSMKEIRLLWMENYEKNVISRAGSEDLPEVRIFPYLLGGGPGNGIAKMGRKSSIVIPIAVICIWILTSIFLLINFFDIEVKKLFVLLFSSMFYDATLNSCVFEI